MGIDHKQTTISDGSPMSAHIRTQRQRKRWKKYRQRFLALSPEEQKAHGGTMVFEDPPMQSSPRGEPSKNNRRGRERHKNRRAEKRTQH